MSQTDHRGRFAAFEPDDAGGPGLPAFEQGGLAEALPPGPLLGELSEAAVKVLPELSDDQLTGAMQASLRQQNREAWRQALMVAEFARRRGSELRAAEERGVPVHQQPGQFPGEELAMELVLGPVQAGHKIDDATDLVTRLPATLAGMAAGLIDADRAGIIAVHTRVLSTADVALADRVLAAVAPSLRLDQLLRRACALELKLAPEAVRARRERARRTLQRVEVRREESGNASVAGRELTTTDALASKAHIHGLALRLRRAGMPGTLDQLRVLVFTDLTAGRDPLHRLEHGRQLPEPDAGPSTEPAPGSGRGAGGNGPNPVAGRGAGGDGPNPVAGRGADGPAGAADSLDYAHDEDGDDSEQVPGSGPGLHARPPGPVPATINLIVPAGTLFGGDSSPAEAGGWGLLDAEETRALVAAASRHPTTRWCVTVTGADGTAVAHGCAAGRHPWSPPPERGGRYGTGPPGPTPTDQLIQFLRGLNPRLLPVARGSCDHAAAERRYTPGRTLTHLVRARTATCDAPGCAAQAVHADLDHTVPYPAGPTDQCNLGPKCRRHHRVKHARGWKVEQPRPGVIRWTLPSGRTHVTRPTIYDPLALPAA